jgi:hypothetical protein
MGSSVYREEDLVSNRASVMLYGGTESERALWAEEAAFNLGTVLRTDDGDLVAATANPQGVLFIAQTDALTLERQGLLVAALKREERPKLVLGFSVPALRACEEGHLRDDLYFLLRAAQVNLELPGMKGVISARRARNGFPPPPPPKPATSVRGGKPASAARAAARPASKPRR